MIIKGLWLTTLLTLLISTFALAGAPTMGPTTATIDVPTTITANDAGLFKPGSTLEERIAAMADITAAVVARTGFTPEETQFQNPDNPEQFEVLGRFVADGCESLW